MSRYIFLIFSFAIFSCSEEVPYVEINTELENEVLGEVLNIVNTSFEYENLNLPNHFTTGETAQIDNTPIANPITNDGATLGRVLFYDKKLSKNNTVSCASCHVQQFGFSDPNAFSVGFDGELTERNSMTTLNARYYQSGRFFWDERAATLEDQVLLPIQNDIEMGLTLDELTEKVSNEQYYSILFRRAFGDSIVTTQRISFALSKFIRSTVSFESKYDEGRQLVNSQTEQFPNFTDSENLGKDLFFSSRTNCASCHTSEAFTGTSPARNNGLSIAFGDIGIGGVTGNPNDDGKFKTNSLRNIELTAPYMHDGRFRNLSEVMGFYNAVPIGGINNDTRMNLTPTEIDAIISFLLTLTDDNVSNDPKYSNPFLND